MKMVWFGPNAKQGGTGIAFGTVGTGHIVTNNTVNYSWTSAGTDRGVACFQYPNPPTAYAFINNNHCASAAPHSWVAGRGDLNAWKTYSASSSFDTNSITGNPLFTAPGTNFRPAAGSPLIGAGNTTYANYIGAFAP